MPPKGRYPDIRELIGHNKGHLNVLYEKQRRLSELCRREEGGTSANMITAAIPSEDTQHKGPSHKVLVFDAYLDLQRAVGRLSGTRVICPADYVVPEKLREMIARAESPAFVAECVQHLADLDRIGTVSNANTMLSIRALVAREAANLRDAAGKRVLEELIEKAKAVLDSKGALPRTAKEAARPAEVTLTVAERLDEVFEMGYIGPLWRGIERALPSGVERMTEEMERASVPS
jgi:hypothetical protein